jgi:uncharacterized protein YwqG
MPTLDEILESTRRRAWRPVVEGGEAEPTESNFGGRPWMPEGGEWPRCGICERPAPMFLQLNLATLPESCRFRRDSGIVQLFYCTRLDTKCELECDAWKPWSANTVTRWHPEPTGEPNRSEEGPTGFEVATSLEEKRGVKRIVDWAPIDDHPHWEELFDDFNLGREHSPELDRLLDTYAERPDLGARVGDKLGGWPHWIQGPEYPDCPTCGERMEGLFQIDSEDDVPHGFGDLGCAHLTQCPEHPEQMGFGWSCY